MKRICLFLVTAITITAQSLNLSVSPALVKPGGTSILTFTFTDAAPTANIAGLEWTLSSSSLQLGAMAPGASSTAANKVITCNGLLCLDAGTLATALNVTPFASGVVGTIPITVPATAIPGAVPLSLSGLGAVSATGIALTTMTSSPATLTVLSKYDINSDGVVNAADVQIATGQASGSQACTTGDVNGDGVCNITDVILEILAALGLIH